MNKIYIGIFVLLIIIVGIYFYVNMLYSQKVNLLTNMVKQIVAHQETMGSIMVRYIDKNITRDQANKEIGESITKFNSLIVYDTLVFTDHIKNTLKAGQSNISNVDWSVLKADDLSFNIAVSNYINTVENLLSLIKMKYQK